MGRYVGYMDKNNHIGGTEIRSRRDGKESMVLIWDEKIARQETKILSTQSTKKFRDFASKG